MYEENHFFDFIDFDIHRIVASCADNCSDGPSLGCFKQLVSAHADPYSSGSN
jgi:hypothetical protein